MTTPSVPSALQPLARRDQALGIVLLFDCTGAAFHHAHGERSHITVQPRHFGQQLPVFSNHNPAPPPVRRLGENGTQGRGEFAAAASGWACCLLVHRVSALADMQSAGRVIEAAQDIPAGELVRLPRERRASHLLDVSRGYLQAGQRDEAATTLLDADQLAREEVRCRDLTRQVITDLVRSYPRGTRPLSTVTQLARAVGVTV